MDATVSVPCEGGQRHQETHTFSTTTGLLLADWLPSYGVSLVGMEARSAVGAAAAQVQARAGRLRNAYQKRSLQVSST